MTLHLFHTTLDFCFRRSSGRSVCGDIIATLIPLLPLLLTSCISDFDGPPSSRQGLFSIDLSADSLVAEVETRAPRNLTTDEAANYLVTLSQEGTTLWEHKVFSTITVADRTQPLGNGYVVLAENVTAEDAESTNDGWGCQRFAGESEAFAVTSGQTTYVTVPCRMANAGLSVVFDESFTNYFSEYAVTTDDLRALKFNADNQGTAYYNTDASGNHTLAIGITASAGWDGTVRLRRTLTLKAGKIIRLHVKLNSDEPTEGNITLSITYDDSFEETDGEEIILE